MQTVGMEGSPPIGRLALPGGCEEEHSQEWLCHRGVPEMYWDAENARWRRKVQRCKAKRREIPRYARNDDGWGRGDCKADAALQGERRSWIPDKRCAVSRDGNINRAQSANREIGLPGGREEEHSQEWLCHRGAKSWMMPAGAKIVS
jgi:hypothetical protein